MDKFIVAACLASAALMTTAASFASTGPEDYVARLNEEGLYCARIKTTGINGLTLRKTRCRTLEQWEAKGYIVDLTKDPSEV